MEAWLKSLFTSILLIFVIIIVLRLAFFYFTPFVIAVLLAGFINPAVKKFEICTGLDRPFSIFIILVFLIATIIFFLVIGISQIYLEINNLLYKLPDYNKFVEKINIHNKNLYRNELIDNKQSIFIKFEEALKNNIELLYNDLKDSLLYIGNKLLYILMKLPSALSIIFISFIATYFISRDIDKINNFIMGLFPERLKPKIYLIEKEIISSALGFLRAELVLVFTTGIISYLGFLIIGTNYASLIGLCVAFLDLIPFIGIWLLYIPLILFYLFSGQIIFAFKILVVFIITVGIRQGIEGKVVSSQIGLHPLATMIAFYVGYRLMGLIGFIIGPIALVFVKAFFSTGILPQLINFKE